MDTGTEPALAALAQDVRYLRLVRRRSTLGWTLAGVMIAVYFCFVLLVAFARNWLGQPVAGGATSIGIPIGLGVILVAIGLTGFYVHRANTVFDREMDGLRREYAL